MANVLIESQTMTDIADAIREKGGTDVKMKPAEMPKTIREMESVDTGVGSRQWWLDVCKEKTTYMYLFYNCKSITTIPILDMANNNNMKYMFANCTSLVSVPLLDLQNIIDIQHTFYNCINLVHIKFVERSIKKSIMFAQSPLLSDESIQSIIYGLATVTDTQTITFHSTVFAKLTDEQKTQILNKGWIIE